MARGGVLLGIALANVPLYLYGSDLGAGYRPIDGSALDRALDFVVALLVNERSRPMFALLFGFGLATMAARMTARGASAGRQTRVLVRRNLWLIAFGAVHAALLFGGDILGAYGVTGLLALLFLHRRPRVLVAWGVVSVTVLGVVYGLLALLDDPGSAPTSNYLVSVVERLQMFTLGVAASGVLLFLLAPTLVGVVMVRVGILDRPWEHISTLRRLAVGGAAVGIAGGLPYALVVGGMWDPGQAMEAVFTGVHVVTGTAMGIAYVSLFALWAARRHAAETPRSGAAGVLATVGERSLTCYLLQSALFAPLLAAWGLGLGGEIGTAEAYGLAVLVWLASVGVAWGLDRAGRRGPFEVLLRRLTYGPRPRVEAPAADRVPA